MLVLGKSLDTQKINHDNMSKHISIRKMSKICPKIARSRCEDKSTFWIFPIWSMFYLLTLSNACPLRMDAIASSMFDSPSALFLTTLFGLPIHKHKPPCQAVPYQTHHLLSWELVDPVVADPIAKRQEKQNTNMYGNSLSRYTERGQNFPIIFIYCHYLVELGPQQLGLPVSAFHTLDDHLNFIRVSSSACQ